MLFYRARLEGCIAAVISLRAGPVRRQAGLGVTEGLSRVVLRYALAPGGEVRVHRGWLHTGLPAGTGLRVLGYQADGPALLLSLRPVRPAQAAARRLEQVEDRFRLPFRLQAWGAGAVCGSSAVLRIGCEPRPESILLWGRLALTILSTGGPLRLQIPFCRLLAAPVTEGLAWRAWGRVVGLTCSAAPDGTVGGEVELAVTCLGGPQPGPVPGQEPEPPPAPATVRELTAAVSRLTVEQAGQGRALLSGLIELETAWAGQDGRSRQTGSEVPFSALISLPGLLEGDRLESAAQVDKVIRVGQGAGSRAALLVSASITALRTVHLPLGGHFYQLEEVVGQGVATVAVEAPLFPPSPSSLPLTLPLAAEAVLPEPPDEGRVLRLPPGVGPPVPLRLSVKDGGHLCTRTELRLAAPARGLRGLWITGGRRWEARLLVRQAAGARLVAEDLRLPAQGDQALWRPVAATACPVAGQGSDPQVIQIDTIWERV